MADDQGLETTYGKSFFDSQSGGAERSARVVVPLVMDLLQNVHSVVDVGCGTGTWLARFRDVGVTQVLGLDGGSAADSSQLEIEKKELIRIDFELPLTLPDRRFDLCICLEVAEHLSPSAAQHFIRSLCGISDVVLFSAAIPGQGGLNHLNERWPSYWAAIFEANGYAPVDVLREKIWHDSRVDWWYRQNMIFFLNSTEIQKIKLFRDAPARPLDLVHPECFGFYHHAFIGMRTELEESKSVDYLELLRKNSQLQSKLDEIFQSKSWRLVRTIKRVRDAADGLRKKVASLLHSC